MTVYLAFNERESISSLNANVTVTTASEVTLSGINRAGIALINRGNCNTSFPDLSEGWVHVRLRGKASTSLDTGGPIFSLRRNTTDTLVEIRQEDNVLSYGARFPKTEATATVIQTSGTVMNLDINFKIAVAGFVKVFVNNSLVYTYEGDTTFASGSQIVNNLYFASVGAIDTNLLYSTLFSQVLVSDSTTLGAKVYTLPVSVGSVNQWTGTLTDVSASTSLDGNTISESTANESIVMTKTSLPTLAAGESVTALVLAARGLYVAGSAVTKLDMSLKSGATTNQLNAPVTLTESYGPAQLIANQNFVSGTPVAWTLSDANTVEVGLVAEA